MSQSCLRAPFALPALFVVFANGSEEHAVFRAVTRSQHVKIELRECQVVSTSSILKIPAGGLKDAAFSTKGNSIIIICDYKCSVVPNNPDYIGVSVSKL